MRTRLALVALSIVVCAGARPSWSMDLKLGGEVFGTFNTYSMSQFNDKVVDQSNATGITDFQRISSGITGGLGARVWLDPHVLVSATWEPLFAETRTVIIGVDSTGTAVAGALRINFDANSYQLGGAYFLIDQGIGWLGLSGAVAYYRLSGEKSQVLHAPGVGIDLAGTDRLTGDTIGLNLAARGEWEASRSFAITGAVGYRNAKITNGKERSAGGNIDLGAIDYSGPFVRVGFAFYLRGANGGGASPNPKAP